VREEHKRIAAAYHCVLWPYALDPTRSSHPPQQLTLLRPLSPPGALTHLGPRVDGAFLVRPHVPQVVLEALVVVGKAEQRLAVHSLQRRGLVERDVRPSGGAWRVWLVGGAGG
jgi:hypothetical protein